MLPVLSAGDTCVTTGTDLSAARGFKLRLDWELLQEEIISTFSFSSLFGSSPISQPFTTPCYSGTDFPASKGANGMEMLLGGRTQQTPTGFFLLSEKKTPSVCKIQLIHLQPEWEPCASVYSLVSPADSGGQEGQRAPPWVPVSPARLPSENQGPDAASATECHVLPSLSVCPQASDTLCLSIPPQFITKFLKYYIFYYIQIHFIAFDNTDNHIPYALMFRTQCMLTAVFIHDA